MNLDRRIAIAAQAVKSLARPQESRSLKGAEWEAVLAAVDAAIADEDAPILETILDQVAEYDAAPPHKHAHGLRIWLTMLLDGYALLPAQLPSSVWLVWRDHYVSDWHGTGKPWCPIPLWKCQDCGMVLPHGGLWEGCPVCGSSRVWHSDLSEPLGVAWVNPKPYHKLMG